MYDIVRDAAFGQLLRVVSPKLARYADERDDFVVPPKYLVGPSGTATPAQKRHSSDGEAAMTRGSSSETVVSGAIAGADPEKGPKDEAPPKPKAIVGPEGEKYVLVDWDGPDDPDRPLNWSVAKKRFFVGEIMLLTFAVYIGSAIYTSSIPGIMEHFGVSQVRATWGMTLFIFAYGLGPMVLAPLQDMHTLGRNSVYIPGLFLFVIFQLPVMFAPNLATILAFRFLAGFVGSPALATGGASVGDPHEPQQLPILISLWAIGAVCGPVAGPVIGGFAAQAKGWQWPIYELTWISAFAFVVLFFLLPETLESKILYDRARRLRKLTGNQYLRSEGEIAAMAESKADFWKHALLRPFLLMSEPAVLFSDLYIGLAYAAFYLWFESFPIVFEGIYGFNLGESGLPYLAFIVAAAITWPAYVIYQKQRIDKKWAREGGLEPEIRLEIALIGSFLIPISILVFGWASRPSVSSAVPIIFAGVYLPGIYLVFQGCLIYIASSYPPKDAASILAGNDLARSSLASVFPLFGSKYFNSKLGLGGGSTLLAGVAAAMIPVMWLLKRHGKALRARSKYAM